MRGTKFTALLDTFSALVACDSDPAEVEENTPSAGPIEQLITIGDVTGSLNPFELIENPAYSPVHEVDFMQDNELVFISKACGYVLVYPHRSMHVEIVNEEAHGVLMALTYCPITRSGIGLNRLVGGDTLLLTASGYLHRDNLMPLDINSGSIWSQMLLRGMTGKHNQMEFEVVPVIETTWITVRDNFPGAGVYLNKSFRKSVYGPYKQEFGILGRDHVELFHLDMFEGEISLKNTSGKPGGRIVVAGSSNYSFIVAYHTGYDMEPVFGEFPVIMKDETGSYWNIFGEAVSGQRGGEKLRSPVSYTAADWAWTDQFENVTYFENQKP